MLSTYRKLTSEDYYVLNKRSEAFAKRHGIGLFTWEDAYYSVAMTIETNTYLSRLFNRVVERALQTPRGCNAIGWGYVGWYHA